MQSLDAITYNKNFLYYNIVVMEAYAYTSVAANDIECLVTQMT